MSERTFQQDEFVVTRSAVGNEGVRIVWKGTFRELSLPEGLLDLLGLGAEPVPVAGVRSIELRFEELVSINSSMMVYLTRFVRELGTRAPHLTIHYNPEVEFQEVLFPIIAETLQNQNPSISVEVHRETHGRHHAS